MKKLLIVTQKVDKRDPILGFFHRWIEEFAKYSESVIVICLEKGEYSLPQNVSVLSLGKEEGRSKAEYISNFYRHIWRKRDDYDAVFVHMNQEYILLAGLIWRIWGKKISFWRNHAKGNLLTRVAVWLSHRVFYTSPHSYTAKFSKSRMMPVGIDTDFFSPDDTIARVPNSVLFLGRISPVKNVHMFVDALDVLNKRGVAFIATIAGPVLERDREYATQIKEKIEKSGLADKVNIIGPVDQEGARALYRSHELYVNLTPSGSMDKTIFEACASGMLLLAANTGLKAFLEEEIYKKAICDIKNTHAPSNKIYETLLLEERDKRIVRERLIKAARINDLSRLIEVSLSFKDA